MPALDPDALVPNANSPQLLTQLLELMARGVRSSRALHEALGVDPRTVAYYRRTGEWFGFLDPGGTLTPLGLEYVFAGSSRPRIYAMAAWEIPLVQELLVGRTTPPTVDDVTTVIARVHPELAPATARRRASAVRSLLSPVISRPRPRPRGDRQLALPLPRPSQVLRGPERPKRGAERDPGLYRFLLAALIDHGELTLGHVRALLDHGGSPDAPIGGYIELALSRGDARRHEDRLVVTPTASRWQDLCESTPSIILSDPDYRRWLSDLASGDEVGAARRRRRRSVFLPWDLRLFGEEATPLTLERLLAGVLVDRGLNTWPARGDAGVPPTRHNAPFLDIWQDATNITVTAPPALALLQGGVSKINRVLRDARAGGNRVGMPGPVETTVLVHGGLLHPGERLPRSIPDTRSLRIRAISNAPYVALTIALLLGHRGDPSLELVRRDEGWLVVTRRRPRALLLDLLDGFCQSRSWSVARRARGGLTAEALIDSLQSLGLALVVGRRMVLDEAFFIALRDAPEEGEVRPSLEALRDALTAHLTQRAPGTPS